ncbi:MAG: tetratricopeptide repeat protein [Planctomycetota bacterium]|nr:tetratricopeptide repeat protein [Planctomycetota bacterium]
MHRNRFTTWFLALVAATLVLAPSAAEAGTLDAAKKALDKGDYEKAAERFLKVCKKDEGSREAPLGLAEATYKGKLNDDYLFESEDALSRLIEKDENDYEANLMLGEVYLLKASRQRDPQLLRGYYEDARITFSTALAQDGKSQQAAVGIAKALYYQGDFIGAEDTIDAYLAKKPEKTAEAHFWRGEAISIQARDKYGKERQLTDEIKGLYKEAKEAYAESTKVDPSSYEAWVKMGQAAHWSQDFAGARTAYLEAVKNDTKREHIEPLKGLASLHAHEPDKYTETLAELAEKHPKHEHVLLYGVADHFGRKRDEAALKLIESYVKVAKNPSAGHFYAGEIKARGGDKDGAIAAYKKSLASQPDREDAAWAWSQLLVNQKDLVSKVGTWSKSQVKDLIAAYQPLFKAAPKNIWSRNSLGFALREFAVRHASEGWDDIFVESAKAYESATLIIGEYDASFATKFAFNLRYGYAQVVSDTALMFQFYPATRDLKKAETYYLRALDWSDQGYFDAWNNLRMIYESQKRWDDLYDLASLCADGLVRESGLPHQEGRAQARSVMDKLEKAGLAGGE